MVIERAMRRDAINALTQIVVALGTSKPLADSTPEDLREIADEIENLMGEEERTSSDLADSGGD